MDKAFIGALLALLFTALAFIVEYKIHSPCPDADECRYGTNQDCYDHPENCSIYQKIKKELKK